MKLSIGGDVTLPHGTVGNIDWWRCQIFLISNSEDVRLRNCPLVEMSDFPIFNGQWRCQITSS